MINMLKLILVKIKNLKRYNEGAVTTKETKLKKWREGEVIQVDIVPGRYHEMYLFSDGTISETHWED